MFLQTGNFNFNNDLLQTSSMIVNLAWALKLSPCIRKCLSQGGPSVLETSFLCLFILKFNLHSDFPAYCDFSKRKHSIRQIMQLLLQVTLSLIKKAFLLKALWKVEQVLSCLQHRLIDLLKRGWHFPMLNLSCYQNLFKTLLPPIMSPMFLFLLNAKIGGSAKMSFNFVSTCKIGQFLSIIVLRSGRVLLYVTVSGKSSVLDVVNVLFSNSFLGIEIARLICVAVSVLL